MSCSFVNTGIPSNCRTPKLVNLRINLERSTHRQQSKSQTPTARISASKFSLAKGPLEHTVIGFRATKTSQSLLATPKVSMDLGTKMVSSRLLRLNGQDSKNYKVQDVKEKKKQPLTKEITLFYSDEEERQCVTSRTMTDIPSQSNNNKPQEMTSTMSLRSDHVSAGADRKLETELQSKIGLQVGEFIWQIDDNKADCQDLQTLLIKTKKELYKHMYRLDKKILTDWANSPQIQMHKKKVISLVKPSGQSALTSISTPVQVYRC